MTNIKISELNSLSKKAYNDVVPIVDVSANETKKVSIEELVDNNVSLIAVTNTAPSECEEGDMYYNTTTNLIYTATDEDTWGETGETPKNGIMYIVYSQKSTYAYDGTELVSVGGGSGAYIGTTQPPADDNSNVWINPNESVNVYGNYISNSYGTSQEIGYSQKYVNNANSYSTSEVDTGKTWIDGKKIYRKVLETNFEVGSNLQKNYDLSSIGLSNISTLIELNSFSQGDPKEQDYYSDSNDMLRTFMNATTLAIIIGSNYPARPCTIYTIVEYTKTTD